MDLNDWILAFHLISAAALVGAEVMFGVMIAFLWRTDSTTKVDAFMPVSRVATALVMAGTAGTIVFGVWLAISLDAYQLWDGWIIAALVLWAIASFTGQQAGNAYGGTALEASKLAGAGTPTSPAVAETFGPSRAFQLHLVSNAAILLLILDMIWKPGA